MSKQKADSPGVPVQFDEDALEPAPVAVAVPPEPEDASGSDDSDSKSGQKKAATQKKES